METAAFDTSKLIEICRRNDAAMVLTCLCERRDREP